MTQGQRVKQLRVRLSGCLQATITAATAAVATLPLWLNERGQTEGNKASVQSISCCSRSNSNRNVLH